MVQFTRFQINLNGEIMDLRNYYGDKADEKVLLGRIEKVKNAFYSHEKVKPERLFSSSGRAEILGNHTDHNHAGNEVRRIRYRLNRTLESLVLYFIYEKRKHNGAYGVYHKRI